MYRNGYYDPVEARPRGHNLYTQNSIGTKLVKDNITFEAYDHGIHPYTAENSITGFRFVGNISFNKACRNIRVSADPISSSEGNNQ
jgi:hypothetical protein